VRRSTADAKAITLLFKRGDEKDRTKSITDTGRPQVLPRATSSIQTNPLFLGGTTQLSAIVQAGVFSKDQSGSGAGGESVLQATSDFAAGPQKRCASLPRQRHQSRSRRTRPGNRQNGGSCVLASRNLTTAGAATMQWQGQIARQRKIFRTPRSEFQRACASRRSAHRRLTPAGVRPKPRQERHQLRAARLAAKPARRCGRRNITDEETRRRRPRKPHRSAGKRRLGYATRKLKDVG